ncbi:MAG: Unknown protein [uncultured Sulfurovum sp.]|uniref:Uncharacterized protein n=1 Tax=uncultured Sulfurovum sp. TaxID=269237 RepID=A0A6S6THH0_9BACT|nr:MAG: Unknown protein [uncultured Sulfurovum sp.]
MQNKDTKKSKIGTFSYQYLARAKLSYIITMPSIIMMIIPAVIADIFATIYQIINFSVYKIPKVKRSKYIVIDRHHLSYLNGIEKLFCVFCGYVNGVIQYAAEIGTRTEEFWCPIKHNQKIGYEHSRYHKYLEYGDSETYHKKRKHIRLAQEKELKEEEAKSSL